MRWNMYHDIYERMRFRLKSMIRYDKYVCDFFWNLWYDKYASVIMMKYEW